MMMYYYSSGKSAKECREQGSKWTDVDRVKDTMSAAAGMCLDVSCRANTGSMLENSQVPQKKEVQLFLKKSWTIRLHFFHLWILIGNENALANLVHFLHKRKSWVIKKLIVKDSLSSLGLEVSTEFFVSWLGKYLDQTCLVYALSMLQMSTSDLRMRLHRNCLSALPQGLTWAWKERWVAWTGGRASYLNWKIMSLV